MITVTLNRANFEYDIHSLVKAFYPEHDVVVRSDEPLWDEYPLAKFHIDVIYGGDDIAFVIYDREAAQNSADRAGCVLLRDAVSVSFDDRGETKNRLKRKLYEMLSALSGRTLPWGTLTGIRPTKIPMEMLEEGVPESDIRSLMREKYLTSDEKTDLSIEVAKRESELLSHIDYENGYSLYIGIPFCPSTCLYCSFTSYPINTWQERVDEYLDALATEMKAAADMCEGRHVDSVYIGGGTPTSLSPGQLDRLISSVLDSFGLNSGEQLPEFTVEAGRPDSITAEKLAVLKSYGINRISINPQTMNEDTLKVIGRHHTPEQIRESFAMARGMGFDNINMDIIIGLPGEDIEDVRHTMNEIEALSPDNVTVHSLAVKRASRLRIERENYAHLRIENSEDIIHLTSECCRRMGLFPYYLYRQKNIAGNFENVGYAAPGKAGVYNVLIMEEKQTIMALGAGASTKIVFDHGNRIERAVNVKDVDLYIRRVDEMIDRKRRLFEKFGIL